MSSTRTALLSAGATARWFAAAVALTATVFVGLAFGAASGNASTKPIWHDCGVPAPDGAGYFRLKWGNYSDDANCHRARRVANRYAYQGIRDPGGWRCRLEDRGYESAIVKCSRHVSGPFVKFRLGA